MHVVRLFFIQGLTTKFYGKIVGLTALFALLPLLLTAQYERILNDRNVTWAAELDIIYQLAPPQVGDPVFRNDIIYWKNYDPRDATPYEGSEMLLVKLLDAVRSGAWPAWDFGDKPRQLSLEETIGRLDERDTVEVLNFETGLYSAQAVVNEADIHEFFAIRAKQLLYYDAKKAQFNLYTSAIAPVRHRHVEYRYSTQEPVSSYAEVLFRTYQDSVLFDYVPFWLKMPEYSRKNSQKGPDVDDRDVTWAAQLKTLNLIPEIEILRPRKDVSPPVMRAFLDRFRDDRVFPAFDPLGQPLSRAERADLLIDVDTVLTYDPETYEEAWKIVRTEIQAADLYRLRLIEAWCWDERRQRLHIRLQRHAPLVEVFDEDGNYRYDRVLFYRRND